MNDLVYVGLGAALGAPARYVVDRAVQARHDSVMPWGTVTVNVAGSLVLGLFLGLAGRSGVPSGLGAAVAVGFCGAFTTYSTLTFETFRLLEDGARRVAALNVLVTLAAGLAAVAVGYAVTGR